MSLPLPPLALWTDARFGAVLWDGFALQAWGTGEAMVRPAAMRRISDPTHRPRSPAAGARRLLGTAASAAQQALVAALWPLFEDSGSVLALPGATAKACVRGTTLSLAVLTEAPPATFVIPGMAFTDDLRPLLHPAVPEGDHFVPCDASAHERLAAARTWGPDLPPEIDGLAWRRARHRRAVALAALEEHDLPTVMGLRILP
jgi:hypothetical protein